MDVKTAPHLLDLQIPKRIYFSLAIKLHWKENEIRCIKHALPADGPSSSPVKWISETSICLSLWGIIASQNKL